MQTKVSKQTIMLSQAYNIQLAFKQLKEELKGVEQQKPFYFPIMIENVEKAVNYMIALCTGEHQRVHKLAEKRRKAGDK